MNTPVIASGRESLSTLRALHGETSRLGPTIAVSDRDVPCRGNQKNSDIECVSIGGRRRKDSRYSTSRRIITNETLRRIEVSLAGDCMFLIARVENKIEKKVCRELLEGLYSTDRLVLSVVSHSIPRAGDYGRSEEEFIRSVRSLSDFVLPINAESVRAVLKQGQSGARLSDYESNLASKLIRRINASKSPAWAFERMLGMSHQQKLNLLKVSLMGLGSFNSRAF